MLQLMSGCAGPLSFRESSLTSPGPLANAAAPLVTPTYDGSGNVVEPTVIYFPREWRGFSYWMAVSPYPDWNAKFENPSILVSQDGQGWRVPPGLTNPIYLPTEGNLADATVFYDNDSDQLWVYFLNDVPGIDYHESLLRTTSADGIEWSKPEVLISGSNTFVNSPSVGKVGSIYYLWAADTGIGCASQTSTINRRTSSDGVNWSLPLALNISQPGYVLWHLNVLFVPSKRQFMTLFAAYPLGSDCAHTRLFFANSRDGVNWQTYLDTELDISTGWDSGEIYRSSLVYDPSSSLLRVWYSAVGSSGWHAGYTEKHFPIP